LETTQFLSDFSFVYKKKQSLSEFLYLDYEVASIVPTTKYLKSMFLYKSAAKLRNKRKKFFLYEQLLKLFFTHGLQIRYLTTLNKSVSLFYFYFYFLNRELNVTHQHYMQYVDILPTTAYFFNFEKILGVFTELLEPLFNIRIKRVEKKYRKKLRKKYIGDYIYIAPDKRARLVLKNVLNYSSLFSKFALSSRLSSSLLFTLIEYKSSHLYKKKLFVYTNVLKKLKSKSL